MLAEKHLTRLGFTVEQANEFIIANINQPKIIYDAAAQYGVTTRMLSELSGYSRDIVQKYFADVNPDWSKLLDKSKLVNSDLGTLENLVAFNTREGILSNASLNAVVKPKVEAQDYNYDMTFTSSNPGLQLKDGLYSSGELGVENLDNVPATNDNIESLFYGSIINIISSLDESEWNQIKALPDDVNPEIYQALLLTALDDTPSPIVWNDGLLEDKVTTEAVNIIAKYWTSDLFGILDHSYLGLATA